ncbi:MULTISPECIES: ribosome hibernation-promoting factor, HPF/YfiA family [Flavobacteriaceae]|uniref:ribosome hibernation-promoting factor, HPF/YfiA family n=1 Tax=Flavobacteriaceae TaxID=49546 RepID=UPI0010AEC0F0|nr:MULTISPECIES: ribosome-associated translation inhibitor RaiA [Flavobacteriaceae]NJB35698.1 ribosome-associated translation inhibitor RaiA [Croceivirga sp. JEA036]TKD66004.1 ribosome-associated translation inhibitor RaiA [Flavobacterium sp. ASW18X]
MNITFEYHDIKASERLEELITKKLEHLQEKFDFIVQAQVFLKHENTSSPLTGKICGIQLSVPGPRLFAEASEENYENAIHKTIHELDKQLSKKKEKMKAHY